MSGSSPGISLPPTTLTTFPCWSEDASNIKTLEDLKDKTVGVSSGSTSAKSLVKAMIENSVIDRRRLQRRSTFDPATVDRGRQLQAV